MQAHPIGSQPVTGPSHWYQSSATCNRAYLLAGLRAIVIAGILMGILALIVLT